MNEFVELWVFLASTPLFGLTATLVTYVVAQTFYSHMQHAPWANPTLWSVLLIAGGLLLTGVAYPTYFSGAQFIHFLLGPAVVAMAWPLWLRRTELKAYWPRFVAAALVGGAASVISAVALAWAFDLPSDVLLSLVPKSITAPVAMGVAEKIGGIPALAAVFAVLTGMVGSLSGRYLFDAMGLGFDRAGWMARGFALGTASHGIGAARATQVNADAGAYAGLALGLQVVLGSLLLPLIWRLVA